MPLLKRKPYDLSKPPNDLKAKDLVFQVRLTKEIFKDYKEYLKHVNLYRQRVWTCKYSGKSNLTYEEALDSEHKTTEKVQQFPREFMGPVLHLVQYSMLRIEDLVKAIFNAFKDRFVVGEEVVCVKENVTRPCKIVQAMKGQDMENNNYSYEVELLDNDRCVIGLSLETSGSLVRKKPPFTRALVKSFIRESVKDNASRNSQTPLVVLDVLCHKYGITTNPPEELKKFFLKQEQNVEENEVMLQPLIEVTEPKITANKKRKKSDTVPEGEKNKKQKKVDREPENQVDRKQADAERQPENQSKKKQKKSDAGEGAVPSEDDKSKTKTEPIVKVVPIKYPIEDTLVQPSADDPPLRERPTLSSDFILPMDCTGPLLMVWNFCSLFGKAIRLSPFSLEEFEKALECEDSDPILLQEAHHALIKLILSDAAIDEAFREQRKRKMKVTIQSWKDDLSNLLKLDGFEKLAEHASTIGKGSYKLLEPSVKLEILNQLVECGLGSTAFREQLDVYIEEKQAIAAQKRKEDQEKSKQGREAQELLKQAQTSSTTPQTAEETVASEPPKEEERVEEDDEEQSDSDGVTNSEEPSTEKVLSNGLSNGTYENGDNEEATVPAAGRSRQLALKLKSEQKEAEDLEKEKKRIEERTKLQEIRKIKFEAVRERKLKEKKILELQKRQEHLEREIEKRVIRTHPLGKDRDHNRYWFFAREGRIFVEDKDMSKWGYYSAKEELEALHGSLNTKGIRERALQRQLEKHHNKISDALQRRNKEIAQRVALEDPSVRRSSRGKTAPQQTVENTYRNKYRSS